MKLKFKQITSSNNDNWFEGKYVYEFWVYCKEETEIAINTKNSIDTTILKDKKEYHVVLNEDKSPFTMFYPFNENKIQAVNLVYIEKGEK